MHNDNQPPERPKTYFSPYNHHRPTGQQQPLSTTPAPHDLSDAAVPIVGTVTTRKKSKLSRFFAAFSFSHKHTTKKQILIFSTVGLVIVIGIGAGAYAYIRHYHPAVKEAVLPTKTYTPPPKPTTVASTLTGLPVAPSVNNRQVTAVMVENSPDARPQSGLDQAGVVFEALAEGGVTRFMALYQDSQPNYVGPVRSARPYYIQWLLGFDAAYAHVGGSADGLNAISAWHVKDLNQFYNASAYERITSRYAPHNVYTSIAQLNKVEASKGYTKSTYTGFARKPAAPSKTPNATSINMTFSGYYYDTHYDYDKAANRYKRSEAGAGHMELNKDGSRVRLTPKVVIAMVVPLHSGALDSSGAYYSDYNPIGSGKVEVFQDGTEETGTWAKTSRTSQIVFKDTHGQILKLDPGQTWISAIAAANDVTYK